MTMIYPDLSPKLLVPLELVREQLRLDPRYLDHPACPYDTKTKTLLRMLSNQGQQSTRAEGSFLGRSGSKEAILEEEVQNAYSELVEFADELSNADVSEKMSYFRTRTSLLEKLVSLVERTSTVAEINEFQNKVIDIMEDILTPEQHEEFLTRISHNTSAP